MKFHRPLLVVAIAVVLGAVAARALESGMDSNPYRAITAHNIFGLLPPLQPAVPDTTPPPPELKLNGIMTVYGRHFALCKIHGKSDKSYLLAVGQRADEIELVSVDVKSGSIKINNHGVIQTLTLPKPSASGNAQTAAVTGNVPLPSAKSGDYQQNIASGFNSQFGAGGGNVESPLPQIMPVGYAVAGGDNSGSSGGGNTSSSGNPGSQDSGGSDTSGGLSPISWRLTASRNMESARAATAGLVQSGQAEPLPLTPLTPPGTPAALIGPGQLYFVSAAMNE